MDFLSPKVHVVADPAFVELDVDAGRPNHVFAISPGHRELAAPLQHDQAARRT